LFVFKKYWAFFLTQRYRLSEKEIEKAKGEKSGGEPTVKDAPKLPYKERKTDEEK